MVAGVAEAEVLYRFAALVLDADGGITETERAWLARFGEALAFAPQRCRALEAELFEGGGGEGPGA
jgi:tellurite resistance protein